MLSMPTSLPMDVKGDILVLAGDTGYLDDDMYSVHPSDNPNPCVP